MRNFFIQRAPMYFALTCHVGPTNVYTARVHLTFLVVVIACVLGGRINVALPSDGQRSFCNIVSFVFCPYFSKWRCSMGAGVAAAGSA